MESDSDSSQSPGVRVGLHRSHKVGMLSYYIKSNRSSVGTQLKSFGRAVKARPTFLLRANHLLFLCGANRADGRVSARREAIKKFIEEKHPACRVIYAEAVFDELL